MPAEDIANDLEVSRKVDEIDVPATLTHPGGDGPFPGVVMIAGSGPRDRNWNSPLVPGTNSSAAGFVTLRYDKRASGPHALDNVKRLTGKVSKLSHPG